jgi:hypothetical protein
MSVNPGARLRHYDVTALIGEGGMGQVWQATDTQLNRQVALKILPDAFADAPDRLARFQREAQVLASLNHPGIAVINGIEKSDDTQALVLELVEGPTLEDRIKQGPIPIDEALSIAKQIAEALEVAHEAGVIHWDLKPANIKVVDKRADVWAFGAVLYEILTGRKPFAGDDVSTTLAIVIEREQDWDALPSDLSPVLATYLRCCLAKELKQRVHDVADVRLAMEGAFETAVSISSEQAVAPPLRVWQRPVAIAALSTWAIERAFRRAGVGADERSVDTRHCIPFREYPRSEQQVVRRPQQMTAHSEEILHHAVDGREALELSHGLEAAHLVFTLTGGLMRDLRAIVLVLPSNVDHGRHGRAVRGPVPSTAYGRIVGPPADCVAIARGCRSRRRPRPQPATVTVADPES